LFLPPGDGRRRRATATFAAFDALEEARRPPALHASAPIDKNPAGATIRFGSLKPRFNNTTLPDFQKEFV
jgi:hypothetical protein